MYFVSALFRRSQVKPYDINHPAYKAVKENNLTELQAQARLDAGLLQAEFDIPELGMRYMGGGATFISPHQSSKTLMRIAIEQDKDDIALLLSQACIDKDSFRKMFPILF